MTINTDDATSEKTRESRLRGRAHRKGLRLEKSRSRTPEHITWGTYQLADARSGTLVAWGSHGGYGMNLDEIERALSE